MQSKSYNKVVLDPAAIYWFIKGTTIRDISLLVYYISVLFVLYCVSYS